MSDIILYQLLADVVLVLHLSVVVFIVGGLVMVVAGNLKNWPWVNALWLRLLHLAAILTVLIEAWFGITCPLTALEGWLRTQARASTYSGSFIEHWLQQLLFYDAPSWVFTLAYSLFGLLVVASWVVFPPGKIRQRD